MPGLRNCDRERPALTEKDYQAWLKRFNAEVAEGEAFFCQLLAVITLTLISSFVFVSIFSG